MWGAIVGDIIGSTFEVENHRSPYFELFRKDARFTDDTVCTLAVANILISLDDMPPKESDYTYHLNHNWITQKLRSFCCIYLNRGFGSMFYQWLVSGNNKPYGSFGNGALMRISPVAFYGVKKGWDLKKTTEVALDITNITHNHTHAQRAVSCYVSILFNLIRNNFIAEEAKELIKNELNAFGYNLPENIEYYRVNLEFDLSCETSLLVACAGIIEATEQDEVFNLVVSVGGDSDTYCAIAGPIAEAIWGLNNQYLDKIDPYFKSYDKEALMIMKKLYN